MRRTKIVATLGPACNSRHQLTSLIRAGVDVVRLNFSHGNSDEHRQRADLVREIAAQQGRSVAILGDLQGPKIRIARFEKHSIQLHSGDPFVLDAEMDKHAGNRQRVGIDYPNLTTDCGPGDVLLLDDGRIVLQVVSASLSELGCKVLVGGMLSDNKGINRQGGGLSASALTDKDISDIHTAADIGVDYLAVSFPRDAEDIRYARSLLEKVGCRAGIIAKIERAEAVSNEAVLDGLIDASEGVMVARGDLGVEIGDAQLIGMQKHIISRARKRNKVAITATQMMESMINNPMPTRAEVSDVANAVLDGTDAVMLSAETAAGSYPTETVEAMVRIILGAENQPKTQRSGHRIHEEFTQIDETIALSAIYAANHLGAIKGVICMTATGQTPLLMSRLSSNMTIFAMTPHIQTRNRTALFRGVHPLPFDISHIPSDEVNQQAVNTLKMLGAVKDGDLVLMTKGDFRNVHGGTNTLKIVRVGSHIL